MENTNEGPARNATQSVAGGTSMTRGIVVPIRPGVVISSPGGANPDGAPVKSSKDNSYETSRSLHVVIANTEEGKKSQKDTAREQSRPQERVTMRGETVEQPKEFTDQPPKKTNREFADEIFEIAKKDGVEKAFEELANGKKTKGDVAARTPSGNEGDEAILENHKIEHLDFSSRHSELVSESHNEVTESEEVEAVKEITSENAKVEISPIQARINAMEAKIANLSEQNKQLAKRAEEAQKQAKDSIEMANRLAQLLEEIAQEDEEEKKKKEPTILEKITQLLAKALMYMTMSDAALKEYEEEERQKAQAQALAA